MGLRKIKIKSFVVKMSRQKSCNQETFLTNFNFLLFWFTSSSHQIKKSHIFKRVWSWQGEDRQLGFSFFLEVEEIIFFFCFENNEKYAILIKIDINKCFHWPLEEISMLSDHGHGFCCKNLFCVGKQNLSWQISFHFVLPNYVLKWKSVGLIVPHSCGLNFYIFHLKALIWLTWNWRFEIFDFWSSSKKFHVIQI